MNKISELKNRTFLSNARKAFILPVDGMSLRRFLLRVLTSDNLEEIFQILPEQQYLDHAIEMLNRLPDCQIFSMWRSTVDNDKDYPLDEIEKGFFAAVDLAWTFYTVKYFKDHPKEWEEFMMKITIQRQFDL